MGRTGWVGRVSGGAVAAALLVAVGILAAGPAAAPAARAQQAGDAALLRELAERLLAVPIYGPQAPAPRVQLLPGQLPDDLPLDLPLPPGTRVVGSSVRQLDAPLPSNVTSAPATTIVLDVPGTASDVIAAFEQALRAQGWSPAQGGPFAGMGGFQGAGMGPGLVYCQTPDGPSLTLSAYPEAQGLSNVRINVANGPGLCSVPTPPVSPRLPGGAERIPRLYPPDGVVLQTSFGGGGGPDRWTSEAEAVTDKSAAELEAFFAQQLAAAGWTRQAGSADGPLAWSLWAVPGEGDWQGLLLVFDGPGANRRALSVRVESPTPTSGNVGSYSYYPAPGVASGAGYIVPAGGRVDAPIGPAGPSTGPGFAPAPTPAASRP